MRKGHGRKRKQKVRPGLPFRRQAIVPAEEKHQILPNPLRLRNKANETRRIHGPAKGIKKDFARASVPLEQLKTTRHDFAHDAISITIAALQKLSGYRISVRVTRLSDKVDEDLQRSRQCISTGNYPSFFSSP